MPEDDRHTYSKEYLEATLTVLMGGRVSEQQNLGQLTTGAGNDIERASGMARKMVCEWGMSEKLGPLTFGKKEEQIFLGREISQHRDYSETTAQEIDDEVRSIVDSALHRAEEILEKHKDALIRLSEALLERESLDANEIAVLVEGGTLPAPSESGPPAEAPGGAPETDAPSPRKNGNDPGVLPTPGNQPA